MRFLPVWAAGLLIAVGALLGAQQSLAGLLAATIAVLLLLAVALAVVAAPAHLPARSLRRRALVAQTVRERDPDSDARPRPRAPSAA